MVWLLLLVFFGNRDEPAETFNDTLAAARQKLDDYENRPVTVLPPCHFAVMPDEIKPTLTYAVGRHRFISATWRHHKDSPDVLDFLITKGTIKYPPLHMVWAACVHARSEDWNPQCNFRIRVKLSRPLAGVASVSDICKPQ